MRFYLIYIATLMLWIATACDESSIDGDIIDGSVVDEQLSDQSFDDDGVVSLAFSAVVDGYESTRSGKEVWSEGDRVNVVYELTSLVSDDALPDLRDYQIIDVANGTLSPCTAEDEIFYRNGENNSYFAIYPSGVIADGSNKYIVDLTDQTGGVAALDMLYASSVVMSQGSSDNLLSLSFRHQYALVKFTLSGVTLSSDAVIELKGAYSKAEFNIMSGEFESQEISNISLPVSTSFEFLTLPWQSMSDIELIIYSESRVTIYKPNIVEADGSMVVWKAGQQYEYNISL